MAVCMVKDNPLLKNLDGLLRCGICYEYMKTTMITSCSHNYCSLCIRKSLMYKSQCPACFEEAFDSQLRNNKIVDEVIPNFLRLVELIQNQPKNNFPQMCTNETNKRQNLSDIREIGKVLEPVCEPTTSEIKVRETKGLSTDDDNSNYINTTNLYKEGSSKQEYQSTSRVERQIPSMFTPKKNSFKHNVVSHVNLVACPVCNVDIPDKNINTHLDDCLKRSEMPQESSSKHVEKRKPLPKLVYPLLSDKEIKKKLKELGLSIQGDRKILISRHQRFTLLYNSECDSINPKPAEEILQQVEREEKEEKKTSSLGISSMLKIDRKTDPKVIEQAHQQYLQQNKKNFNELIQAIKNRESSKKIPFKPNRIESEDEDDNISKTKDCKIEIQEEEITDRKPAVYCISDDDDTNDIDLMTVPDMCRSGQKADHCSDTDIENMDEASFDVSDTDKVTSPVLGRHVGALPPRRENENDFRIKELTPDMFLSQNVSSEDGSNESFSILSQVTQDIKNTESSKSKPCEHERKRSCRKLDSQVTDPDFVPDDEDISQEFHIKRQPSRYKRKVNKPSSSISTGEGRTLRKRSKH